MEIECPDCDGTGVIKPCPHCKGTGKIEHNCRGHKMNLLIDIYGCNLHPSALGLGFRESLGIYQCSVCGQLWQIRFQLAPGTGGNDIWMRPGESERYYDFPEEEAATVMQILNAKHVSELCEGLAAAGSYLRNFAKARLAELSTRKEDRN